MAEAECAVGEFQRDLPVVRVVLVPTSEFVGGIGRSIDEIRGVAGIGRIDGRMQHPSHQILADDVVIDQRQRASRAEKAFVGGTEMGVVVQQRK